MGYPHNISNIFVLTVADLRHLEDKISLGLRMGKSMDAQCENQMHKTHGRKKLIWKEKLENNHSATCDFRP